MSPDSRSRSPPCWDRSGSLRRPRRLVPSTSGWRSCRATLPAWWRCRRRRPTPAAAEDLDRPRRRRAQACRPRPRAVLPATCTASSVPRRTGRRSGGARIRVRRSPTGQRDDDLLPGLRQTADGALRAGCRASSTGSAIIAARGRSAVRLPVVVVGEGGVDLLGAWMLPCAIRRRSPSGGMLISSTWMVRRTTRQAPLALRYPRDLLDEIA